MIERVLNSDPIQIVSAVLLLVIIGGSVLVLMAYGLVRLFDKLPDKVMVVESDDSTPRPTTYQVLPGDTLWEIARVLYPEYDPRDVIHEIRELNHMDSATIYPHEVLRLPKM